MTIKLVQMAWLCAMLLPAVGQSQTTLTYTTSGGAATITGFTGTDPTVLIIPSTIGGCTVTSIGTEAFYGCDSLTSVTIPGSVTSLGTEAFSYCASLTSITIPSSVTSLGQSAFAFCFNLTSVTFSSPTSITNIGADAFEDCSFLTSITIPSTVTSLGVGAFYSCVRLTNVTISSNVTTIEMSAFDDCVSLTSITIPSSVTTIVRGAFGDCTSLTRVSFLGNAPSVSSTVFTGDSHVTIYNLPGTTGWTTFFTQSGLKPVPPAAGTQFLVTTVNTPLTVSASTLAGLDYDADNVTLTITAVSSPSSNGATVSLGGNNLTYTPAANFAGADQFTYTVSDGFSGGTATITVNVAVQLGSATSVFNCLTSPCSGTMNLRGYGVPGNSYDIEVSTDSMATWSTLATVQAGPNGLILYTDTAANTPSRFYRFAVH